MKKVFSVFLILVVAGCATVSIPRYIQDVNPYKRTFYAPFEDVRKSVIKILGERGWKVIKESDPSLFEREREVVSNNEKQTLIYTEMQKASLVVGARHSRVNVFLREVPDKGIETEIRLLTITSTTFKKFYHYRDDKKADRIFMRLEEVLK